MLVRKAFIMNRTVGSETGSEVLTLSSTVRRELRYIFLCVMQVGYWPSLNTATVALGQSLSLGKTFLLSFFCVDFCSTIQIGRTKK